jgi:hypothetical protein
MIARRKDRRLAFKQEFQRRLRRKRKKESAWKKRLYKKSLAFFDELLRGE